MQKTATRNTSHGEAVRLTSSASDKQCGMQSSEVCVVYIHTYVCITGKREGEKEKERVDAANIIVDYALYRQS